MASVPPETRAQIARQRLADLAASLDASPRGPVAAEPDGPPRSSPPAPRLRPAHVRFAATTAAIAAVLTAWWLLAGRPHEVEVPVASSVQVDGLESAATAPTAELVVDVAGKVRRPGIVTLPPGSRIHEAIAAAGGLKGKVDTTNLNLARVLNDGEQVVVGAAPAPTGQNPTGGGAAGPNALVNLNTADLVALDALPGVGPVTAEAIIAWRDESGPFRSVDDLLDVKGIGEATLADLRDRVSV